MREFKVVVMSSVVAFAPVSLSYAGQDESLKHICPQISKAVEVYDVAAFWEDVSCLERNLSISPSSVKMLNEMLAGGVSYLSSIGASDYYQYYGEDALPLSIALARYAEDLEPGSYEKSSEYIATIRDAASIQDDDYLLIESERIYRSLIDGSYEPTVATIVPSDVFWHTYAF